MKILVVAPQPFFVERGTPIAIRALAETLCDAGHEVDLLTTHLGDDIDHGGLSIYRTRLFRSIDALPVGFSLRKLLLDFAIALELFRLAIGGRYDVIHAVEESVFMAIPLRWLGRARLIYDMDSVLSDQLVEKWPSLRWLRPIFAVVESVAIRSADRIVAVCPAIADTAKRLGGGDNVHVVPDFGPDPSDTPVIQEDIREGAEGRPVALYVGNLERYQGVALLLQALAHIDKAERPCLVVIGGDGKGIGEHRELARLLGIQGDVEFLGPRPLHRLSEYLGQADILCSPRMKGVNTPMKLYAYMASGVPMVATDILSHSQVIDRSCAFLGAAEPEALAAAMREALEDPAERLRRGRAARHLARREYSRAMFEKRIRSVYSGLRV